MADDVLKYALAAARRGWKVFPLKPHQKVPDTLHGQKDATSDEETIKGWFGNHRDLNYGIACDISGLYVIDVDSGRGKAGQDTWEKLTIDHPHVPTFTVKTASGGFHYYYAMPDQMALRNSASKLGQDIDTRGNGYVVGPGSKIGSDRYEVDESNDVVPLPAWITEAVSEKPTIIPEYILNAPHADEREVLARIRAMAMELQVADEGQGNNTAARLAYMAGQYVGAGQVSDFHVISTFMDAVAGWEWRTENDFKVMNTTIESQVAAGAKQPRAWTVVEQPEIETLVEQADSDDDLKEIESISVSDWSTDIGQGRFLHLRLSNFRYVVDLGWHAWDLRRWKALSDIEVRSVVQAFYAKKFGDAAEKYGQTTEKKWVELAEAYRKMMNTTRMAKIITAWASTAGVLIPPSVLDNHPELLNTPSGVVNMRTGSVKPHDPMLYLTKITCGNYVPKFRHPDWQAALSALEPEVADYMQLRYGQAATGYTPESDDMMVLTGNGSNGKSLWTTDGAISALGDYAVLASPNLISHKGEGSGAAASPERAALRGQRFVVVEELPEGRSLNIAEIKRVVGTSQITARSLYKNDISFRASHTLFVTSNYIPSVAETDEGTWRRLCRVDFPLKYVSGEPQSPHERQGDIGLKTRLRLSTDGQHDAIVTWLVEGAQRYLADPNLIMPSGRPPLIQIQVQEWRGMTDRILAYYNDRLSEGEHEDMVAKSDLYADFSAWIQASGHTRWSQETFFGRFLRHDTIRSLGVEEFRPQRPDDVSRPLESGTIFSSAYSSLPQRPNCYRGLRFAGKDWRGLD